ncbi:MAG: PIN domain nuclease [Deltaproteobacteria bacterium]|nr:PIN domain nuclease [Deltaproteobacteria bacterium]
MSPLVLIDTSAWICFFARRGYAEIKNTISLLLDEDLVAIAGPIMVELIQGARISEEKEDLKRWIKGLHWLPVSDALWHRAAEMSFSLRRRGITTSPIDTLIAALVIEYDCSLLHRDSHFDLIARHFDLKCHTA